MLKWSHLFTLIHTLLHFVTRFCTLLSPTASAAASIRKIGVSKSHLLGKINNFAESFPLYTHTHNPLQRGLSALDAYHCGDFTSIHPQLGKPFTHYASAACDDHHTIVLKHSETFTLCVPITAYSVDRVHIDIYCDPPVYGRSSSVTILDRCAVIFIGLWARAALISCKYSYVIHVYCH
jgi:hypothetical protein